MTARNFLPAMTMALLLVTSAAAEVPRFDISTSPQEDGYLTEGHVQMNVTESWAARVDYRDRLRYADEEVDGTELSVLTTRTARREVDLAAVWTPKDPAAVDSIYAGLVWVSIGESQDGTWVQTDSQGEYGTQYANRRDGTFFAPTVGGTFQVSMPEIPMILDYDVTLSPVYLFLMNQEMVYTTVDNGREEYPNDLTTVASPYLEHAGSVQISRFVRLGFHHTYQFLPFETFQVGDDGYTPEVVSDPTHTNTLNVGGDITVPLGGDLSFTIGGAFRWSWVMRTGATVPEAERLTTAQESYLRVGARLVEF